MNRKYLQNYVLLNFAASIRDWTMFRHLLELGADIPSFFETKLHTYITMTQALKVIASVDKEVEACRRTLLLFIHWSRKTKLIHPNVATNVIAKQMLWLKRRVWNKS